MFFEKFITRPSPDQEARVLVVRAGALGDIVLTMPALRALHRWAEAGGVGLQIELVGYPAALDVATLAVPIAAVHSIDRAFFSGLLSPPVGPSLRRFLGSYDLVIAWCADASDALSASLAEIGVPFVQADPRPPPGSGRDAGRLLLDSLGPLGVPSTAEWTPLTIPEHARVAAARFLDAAGLRSGRFLAIHPGSGSAKKNWPPSKFARLAALAGRRGTGVLLLAGEPDLDLLNQLLEMTAEKPPVASGLPHPVLAAMLKSAGAYVGNDSGVSHLAAATGAATVCLFGPTDARLWAPVGPRVTVLPLETEPERVWEKARAAIGA